MNQLATKTSNANASGLSVSYKSVVANNESGDAAPEATIITDTHFFIKGFNDVAAAIYGFHSTAIYGQQLFSLVKFELIGTSLNSAIKNLFSQGFWKGDIIYNHGDRKLIFCTRCTLVKNEQDLPSSIVITTQPVTERIQQENKLLNVEDVYQAMLDSVAEGVLLMNANGTIGASNKKAAELLKLDENELAGNILQTLQWKTAVTEGSLFPYVEFPAYDTLRTGKATNNAIVGLEQSKPKKTIWLSVNSQVINKDSSTLPTAVVISFKEIPSNEKKPEGLSQHASLFNTFMNNSATLGWIYDEDGELVYGSPQFMEIIGSAPVENSKNNTPGNNAPEVLATIQKRNRQVLLNGEPLIVEEEMKDKNGISRYYLSYWFLIPVAANQKLVGGHAVEITDKKRAQKEIDKMYERYHFAINASFNAIWDMDFSTGEIYRSENFTTFSGYSQQDILPTIDWFLDKIHAQDKIRIKLNVDYCLSHHITNWENEYRFQVADGTYRHLLDKAHAIYKDGRLTRVIGAMQDITERKKLESQLLHEQVQKQKMINQATIKAQEKERNRISGELHDNVNQLIMSAKLHVCVAKSRAEAPNELLEKANDYLLMAVEEIRGLSKSLTSSLINHVGLQKSIADIGATMLLLKNIQLHTYIREDLVAKLSAEQQLMVYRIIQEQSNNILKYAETDEAIISLKQVNQQVELIISDNGKGFDKVAQKVTGIGFINIFNRVDAYNGKADIITSPGNGCTLIITFPLDDKGNEA